MIDDDGHLITQLVPVLTFFNEITFVVVHSEHCVKCMCEEIFSTTC